MFAATMIERLTRASLEGAFFVLLVALVCRMAPRLRGRHRAMLWWLAAAKLLLTLVPIAPVALAVLPPPSPAFATSAPAVAAATEWAASPTKAPAAATGARSVLIAAWAGGVLVLLASSLRGVRRARAWRRAGETVRDPGLIAAARIAAFASGLRRLPRVALVPGLPGPLVVGLLRPAVLLPREAMGTLEAEELAMVLEHEMAHIARRDLWLGLIPALARRVFFFHPLAWLAEREYAIARESACDEAVVDHEGGDAFAYGRLLLRMSAARPQATAALSPHSMLRRRLEMMESAVRRTPLGRHAAWALLAFAVLAFVPMRLVAHEPAVASTARPVKGSAGCFGAGGATDSAYVLEHGHIRTMCGDTRDMHVADRLRKNGEDLLWFRIGDDAWIIRDQEFIARAVDLFGSEGEAGVEGGVEGGVVGGVVGGIEEQQDRLAQGRAELAAAQAATVEHQRKSRMEMDAQARAEAEVAAARAREASIVDARVQSEVQARAMAEQARKMSEMGARQEALARRMAERSAEAEEALGRMLEDALKNGTAARVQ